MTDAPAGWEGYRRTIVEIRRPREGDLVVRPARPGTAGPWPWPTPDPVYLLTAWDPGEERPAVEVNRRRQASLVAELLPLVRAMWEARGTDPVTGRREEGVAVCGVEEEAVLALAARYGQDAVFVWTPAAWSTVSCRGGRRQVGGWELGGRAPNTSSGSSD